MEKHSIISTTLDDTWCSSWKEALTIGMLIGAPPPYPNITMQGGPTSQIVPGSEEELECTVKEITMVQPS